MAKGTKPLQKPNKENAPKEAFREINDSREDKLQF